MTFLVTTQFNEKLMMDLIRNKKDVGEPMDEKYKEI
jgi:hypothetical protein